MYKEYKNFLSKKEKNNINNSILNNRLFPFYWSENQTSDDKDPFFYHCISSGFFFLLQTVFPKKLMICFAHYLGSPSLAVQSLYSFLYVI
jgi:hypothetical protein